MVSVVPVVGAVDGVTAVVGEWPHQPLQPGQHVIEHAVAVRRLKGNDEASRGTHMLTVREATTSQTG